MGICSTCGGINGSSVTEIVNRINTDAPNPWAYVCPGHAKPEPKHDGKLDDYSVSYADPIYSVYGPTAGIRIKCHGGPEQADLTYTQALFLLAWLRQEETTLEKMAGSEKDEAKG
jgi:hypothetical protein